MVRNKNTRRNNQNATYRQRMSIYQHRSRQLVRGHAAQHAIITPAESSAVKEAIHQSEEEQYVLPSRQPTPEIVLRENEFLAKRRVQNVL